VLLLEFCIFTQVNSLAIKSGGEEFEDHGLIISVVGTKPKEMQKPYYLQMDIGGSSFWYKLEQKFGSFAVSLAR